MRLGTRCRCYRSYKPLCSPRTNTMNSMSWDIYLILLVVNIACVEVGS
ncbi:hypothetical protein MUK42_22347 [Musa troglodytarum]|uniref:Uncharacterized protein n=1 Tax=Musa troglodytarum TaxID=320322 RepID=A0A9E7GI30_9LILI|nr:hypothetical protein MUK42_22347 [Musa troglodytarum]